jgi:hypothetical protein
MNIWLVTIKFQFNIYFLDDAAPIKKRDDQLRRKNTLSSHEMMVGFYDAYCKVEQFFYFCATNRSMKQ